MIIDVETDAVILLGHGSRDRTAIEEFDQFIAFFKKWSGLKRVYPGYLELADPLIPAAIDRAAAGGAKRIWAYPLFIFPGRHVLEDLPHLLTEGQAKHPEVEIYFGEPLNLNPKLPALAKIRIDPSQDREPHKTALLVVGRGTLEPKAIAATERFADQLKPTLPYPHAVHCFAEVVPPYIPDGFARCVELGAASVVVFPCLLFTGIILKRIQKQVETIREKHPDLSIRTAGYFGVHPLLAEIVWEGIKASSPIKDQKMNL
ncbi:MAG TPA: sirohydrochlorin chelatase [Candidatus Manganitrophaceae bacterium]|nr:sirohydrochlorin chelatase [Candidatus Manganitrophaceae bacterium]